MKRVITIIIAAASMLTACSKEESGFAKAEKGAGTLQISVVANTTRAGESDKIYLDEMYSDWKDPDWEKTLAVVLASEDRTTALDGDNWFKSYRSVLFFNTEQEELPAGEEYSYTVKVVSAENDVPFGYTDIATGQAVSWSEALSSSATLAPKAAEGLRLPCFEGKAAGVNVEVDQTTHLDMNVYVANSAVCFDFSESFCKYFAEAHLTLTTADGAEFSIDFDPETPYTKTWYWVNPRGFSVEGTVKRHSPGTGIEGAVEQLEKLEVAAENVKARHSYTYKYDISGVGSTGGITITYDDQPIGSVSLGDFEVNPDIE